MCQSLKILLFGILTILLWSCGDKGGCLVLTDNRPTSDSVKNDRAILYFVGDAMQHSPQINRARLLGQGDYDYSTCFTLIEPYVKNADYAVVNLEVPLGGGRGGYTGYPCFSAPDAYAQALRDAGFDMFLTANNHTLDRLDFGLRRTLNVLDSLGVDHIGTYRDKAQRDSLVPFVKNVNGINIGFLNYTYGTNGLSAREGAEVCLIDTALMDKEIKLAREKGAEILTVCIHWGEEYRTLETASQRQIARFLLDKGVDLIIGAHPHVVEPMLMVDNPATGRKSLVAYSLGNFISNQTGTDSRGGASVTCYLERDSSGEARVSHADYDLFFTAKPSAPGRNFQVVPMLDRYVIPAAQRHESTVFFDNALRLFKEHNTPDIRPFNPNTINKAEGDCKP